MNYGLLITKFGGNIGDDIQSLAAMQFLPSVNYYIHRDKISHTNVPAHTRVIMNGWFMHNTRYWPPHQNIDPLFVSFHARSIKARNKLEWFCDRLLGLGSSGSCSDPIYAKYYQMHAPIGCRDQKTKQSLEAIGVQSYFSGCLSLTLPNNTQSRSDEIVFVDPFGVFPYINYQPELWFSIPKVLRKNATILSHLNYSSNIEKRLATANNYLAIYQRASLVITSRLHVALPCIGFGTNVILIANNHRDYRLKGYEKLLQAHSVNDFLNACKNGQLEKLITKVDLHTLTDLKQKLIAACQKFVNN